MTPRAPTGLVGREVELERIGAFFGREGGPIALWLEGVAGIGKTTLWRAGMEAARACEWRVLSCEPTASETAFSFAALGDLLSPVVRTCFRGCRRRSERRSGLHFALVDAEGSNVDERVVGLALLSSLRLLAARDRVLVAVDDVQWLDAASAAALWFAARRLEGESVTLLLSMRVEPGAAPLQIENDLADRSLRISVGALSSSGLHRIVVASLGRALPRPTLLRVHEASAGNPFYALDE